MVSALLESPSLPKPEKIELSVRQEGAPTLEALQKTDGALVSSYKLSFL